MDEPYIFRFVGDSLANLTNNYVQSASSNLAGALVPVAISGVTLYIVIYGYMVMGGKINMPFSDFLMKCVKIILIAAVALNAGNYLAWVVEGINGLETGLASALSSSGGGTSTYEVLDNALGKAFELIGQCIEHAVDKGPLELAAAMAWLFSAFVIGVGAILFLLIGGTLVIMAKFSLAIMLAIGPLFIMCLFWPPTAGFFDRWFSQTLVYVFTIVLLAVVVSMGIQIFDRLINTAAFTDDSNHTFIALQILFVSGILGWLAYRVGEMASGISGGAAMAAMTLRQAVGGVTAPGRAINNAVNPTSTRLDPRTGMQTTSPRLEHLAQGRSFASRDPAYRQAVMERFKDSVRGPNNSVGKGR